MDEKHSLVVRNPEFDVMAKQLGLSQLDFLNCSVSLMKWAITQKEEGREILSRHPDTDEENKVSMEVLEHIVPPVPTRILMAVQNRSAVQSKGVVDKKFEG